jgi:hypothetical protein
LPGAWQAGSSGISSHKGKAVGRSYKKIVLISIKYRRGDSEPFIGIAANQWKFAKFADQKKPLQSFRDKIIYMSDKIILRKFNIALFLKRQVEDDYEITSP